MIMRISILLLPLYSSQLRFLRLASQFSQPVDLVIVGMLLEPTVAMEAVIIYAEKHADSREFTKLELIKKTISVLSWILVSV